MKSNQKLAVFLSSAAKGQIDGFPKAGVALVRTVLATKRNLLKEIQAQESAPIDNAMIQIAKLALSMRSDDAEPVELVHFPQGHAVGGDGVS